MNKTAAKAAARVAQQNARAKAAADGEMVHIELDLGGEAAAIVAAIRLGNETPRQTIMRLIHKARPATLDIGETV